MIAALFVEKNGCYFGLPDVDPWDEERDARKYAGPWPVVAHPPCERWGRYWHGGPSAPRTREMGDDNGCFASALAFVRKFGGVLEHPEGSHAWRVFELNTPPHDGSWVNADWDGGWTCCVEQGHYGHRARKKTWLYAFGVDIPSLAWGKAKNKIRLDDGCYAKGDNGWIGRGRERISAQECRVTPLAFRDLLLDIARGATISPA
jgi:hypothetical protein